jgi:hypothetical protein
MALPLNANIAKTGVRTAGAFWVLRAVEDIFAIKTIGLRF